MQCMRNLIQVSRQQVGVMHKWETEESLQTVHVCEKCYEDEIFGHVSLSNRRKKLFSAWHID